MTLVDATDQRAARARGRDSRLWRYLAAQTRDSTIGIAAVGYGDGYPRNMRSGTPVLVNGREAIVVGRVSMDMTAIDVTDMRCDRSAIQ